MNEPSSDLITTSRSESNGVDTARHPQSCLISRREFLFGTALSLTVVMVPMLGCAAQPAQLARHPKQRIAGLADLQKQTPLYFNYPDTGPYSENMLVKLGRAAGGGVGIDRDIVAYSLICTHMGGNLKGGYIAENASLGPCPLHLSTFDLTRHGIMVTGQASESLPQIVLEIDSGEVYATGVLGIVYGHYQGALSNV